MSTNPQTLSQIAPSFDETTILNDLKKPALKQATFQFLVTAVTQKINDKGNMVLGLKLAPLDASGNAVKPGASLSLVGPFQTPPEALALAGVARQEKVPNTLFIIEDYARVRQNEKSPFPMPSVQRVEKVAGKYVEVDWNTGTPTGNAAKTKKEHEADLAELHRAARQFYLAAWANPQMLVGDRFYGRVGYSTEVGDFDGPQVEINMKKVPQDPRFITDLADMSAVTEDGKPAYVELR